MMLTKLPELICTVQEAGRAILETVTVASSPETKADGSPVTAADRAAHRVIMDALSRLTPEMPVISEEGDVERLFTAAEKTDSFWLVDPLDGTKEFIKGLPEYTVNIALVHGGNPVLGVVGIPASGVVYWAVQGQGAYRLESPPGCIDRMDAVHKASRKLPLDSGNRDRPPIGVMSRSHGSRATENLFRRLGFTNILRRGSSLKICAVAEGAADFYPRLGPTWYWDTAAAVCVAREAGCRVTNLRGAPLVYTPGGTWKHDGFLVARDPSLLSRAVRILAAERQ